MDSNPVRSLFCPNCGAPLHHGDLTCDYCGVAVYAGQATEVTLPALAEAQQVIPDLRRRIERNPYDGEAYYQLGLALFTIHFYDQAEDAFEQAGRCSPGSALIHYFSGLAMLYRSGDEILSIPDFRIRQIQKHLQTALALEPGMTEARYYSELGDALLARNRQDYAGAIPPLQSVVGAFPKLGMGWQVLAACSFQVADYRAAIRAAGRALELQPYNADLAYLIGAAYCRLGEMDEMEGWARRVADLRSTPDEWESVAREFQGHIE